MLPSPLVGGMGKDVVGLIHDYLIMWKQIGNQKMVVRFWILCCGVSGIMIRLKIVKEETIYSSTDTDKESAIMLHGVKLLIELISPWSGSRRLVCADSYIASDQAAEVMAQ